MQKNPQKSAPEAVSKSLTDIAHPPAVTQGASFDASFDTAGTLSELKKLQDTTKFDKARFSFRLYKR